MPFLPQKMPHGPGTEAKMIALEAVKRAHANIDHFINEAASPAFRRDTLNALARKYNSMLAASGFDGLPIPENAQIEER